MQMLAAGGPQTPIEGWCEANGDPRRAYVELEATTRLHRNRHGLRMPYARRQSRLPIPWRWLNGWKRAGVALA
jgi:hypothetical protein